MKHVFLTIFLIFSLIEPSEAFECSGSTFNGSSFDQTASSFSPYDKIYVMISCKNLGEDHYTMHVNWINNQHGIVRTDQQQFDVIEKSDQSTYFWMKLSRKGPLESVFTNEDFDNFLLGSWTVEGYLNDEPVSANDFEITF